MLRTSTVRSIPRSFTTLPTTTFRSSVLNNALRASLKTSARPARASRVLALATVQPVPKAVVRYAHNAANYDTAKAEKAYHDMILQPVPSEVSEGSSTRHVAGEMQPTKAAEEDDVDMMAGMRSDFVSPVREQDDPGLR
jgi:hypothetical protein